MVLFALNNILGLIPLDPLRPVMRILCALSVVKNRFTWANYILLNNVKKGIYGLLAQMYNHKVIRIKLSISSGLKERKIRLPSRVIGPLVVGCGCHKERMYPA